MVLLVGKRLYSSPQDLSRLVSALNKAVDLYNAAPEKYAALIAERLNIPTELRGGYSPKWRAHVVKLPPEVTTPIAGSWQRG